MKVTELFFKTGLAISIFASSIEASEINIYSHRHYDSDKFLVKEFEKQTGIKVNIVTAKAEELVAKLSIEGQNTPADILITADVGNLYEAKTLGLLQPIKSKILETNVPKHFRDTENEWFGLTKRARVFVYNPSVINPKDLTDYLSLAHPKFNGKILTRTSSNAYNKSLIASIIANYGEEKALKFATGLAENFARNPKGNDRDQITAVAAGDGDIAIVNSYYLGIMLTSKSSKDVAIAKSVRIFFPDQNGHGTHMNISGAGLTKYAKNKADAIKFIEFLSGAQAQHIFAEGNYEYPINPKIKPAGIVASWGNFKEDDIALELVGKYNKLAVSVATKAKWK